jgi:hypothetical protein
MPSRWALGRRWVRPPPLYPSLSSSAMVSGHLAMASEPSSQTLFCEAATDASLLCWVQLVAAMLISDVYALIISLSVNFSDRDVKLNLALLQCSVNYCSLLW